MTESEGLKELNSLFSHIDIHIDDHIPSLCRFPSTISGIGELDGVKEGRFIIQDKASCFPSQLLMDEWINGDIIDACAAPGNKTSHLAALLSIKSNHHKIYAFDKDYRRYQLLQSRMKQFDAEKYVKVQHQDFLSVDCNDLLYSNVSCILVDPSCSGSGVIRSLDRLVNNPDDSEQKNVERLESLRSFQIQVIDKAMSFTTAQTIVYSTCSIHTEENESVVKEILSRHTDWQLHDPIRMKSWTRRGIEIEGLIKQDADKLIRCDPSDGMNGFFIAVFRKSVSYTQIAPSNQTIRKRKYEYLWRPLHKSIHIHN
eukprot:gene19940-25906_t